MAIIVLFINSQSIRILVKISKTCPETTVQWGVIIQISEFAFLRLKR